jgi:hypothetical protein
MAERLGEALLDLDTRDKGLREGVNRGERLAQGLGRTFDLTSAKAIKLGRNLSLAAAAGAAALSLLIKRAIDNADEMSKAASSAGMSTEAFSRLAYAGELADVTVSSLKASLGRLSNQMAEIASGGAKETKALFDQLGIAVTDTEGRLKPVNEVLYSLSDRFAGMKDGAEKTALAIQLFGRSGYELIPMLNSSSKGLADAAREADRFGKTVGTQAGQDAELFNDTLTQTKAIIDGVALRVGVGLLPQLQRLATKLADPEFEAAAKSMGGGIVDAIGTVIDAVETAVGWLNRLGETMDYLGSHDLFGNKLEPTTRQRMFGQMEANKSLREMLGGGTFSTPDAGFFDGFFGGGQGAGSGGQPSGDSSGFFQGFSSASEETKTAIEGLLESLRAERDLLRESDPVQQRMIALREQMAEATPRQRAEVEELVKVLQQETAAWEAAKEAQQFFGDMAVSGIHAIVTGAESLTDALSNMVDMLAQAVLQSMLLGQGPLSGLFGTSNAGGGLGGILGSLFSGFFAKGGLIPNGTFGIVGERGPEPVIGTSRGAMVMPNSTLAGMSAPTQGSTYQVIVQGSDLSQGEMTQAISDAISRFDRFQLPQRVAEIQSDPLARG